MIIVLINMNQMQTEFIASYMKAMAGKIQAYLFLYMRLFSKKLQVYKQPLCFCNTTTGTQKFLFCRAIIKCRKFSNRNSILFLQTAITSAFFHKNGFTETRNHHCKTRISL